MIHSSSDYVMWCDLCDLENILKLFWKKKKRFIQVGYSSMIYMIHWSSHLIYVTFRFCSFPSTRLIILVLFFTDIVSWWLLLEVPASMILTTSTMSAESFWISSQSSTPSLKGTSSVQLTRRTLEFKWGTRRRVGCPTWFAEAWVMVQRGETKTEVWHAKNLVGINRSHKQLLLLYGASDRSPQGKEDGCVQLPPSAISLHPVMHCEELPVPNPPPVITRDDCTTSSSKTEDSHDVVFVADDTQAIPHFPNQAEHNDLIRDLGLTKSKAELLTSRLKQWNLLDESCQVTKQITSWHILSVFHTGWESVLLSRHQQLVWRSWIPVWSQQLATVHGQLN